MTTALLDRLTHHVHILEMNDLEHEWRLWLGENEITPQHPEKHFLKFCRSWYEKRGAPA